MDRSCKHRTLRHALVSLLLVASTATAASLPGFRAELLGPTIGFATSLAVASDGTMYYTTKTGDIVRYANGTNTIVAHLSTESAGDAGLLGLALIDDRTAVVHYTTPGQVSEMVSRVNLTNGSESPLHEFIGDITLPGRFGLRRASRRRARGCRQRRDLRRHRRFRWRRHRLGTGMNAGKIFRIAVDGSVTQLARGFRNPFGMAWDPAGRRLIVGDNGTVADDEINVVDKNGGFYGWPFTAGNALPIDGAIPPVYTFAKSLRRRES